VTPRVAVVHEWLLDYAGSERVLREILEVVPDADLFVLIDRPDQELQAAIPRRARGTTFLQRLPRPKEWLRYYLPLMPFAVGQLDVSSYEIVISSSHAVAKGVKTRDDQLHVSYVHTPMRYAWDMREEYLRAAGIAARAAGRRGSCSSGCAGGTRAAPTASMCSSPIPRTSRSESAERMAAMPRSSTRRSTWPGSRCTRTKTPSI
jgi:hypothetical protein